MPTPPVLPKYVEVNGTSYHEGTPHAVVAALETARIAGLRIVIAYGDSATGRDWGESIDTAGHLSRSRGPVKVPILLKSKRSSGGGALLDHCIVRIRESSGAKRELYRHPAYHEAPSPIRY